jgi:phage-related protein
MKINIEIDSKQLKMLVLDYLKEKIDIDFEEKEVEIKVRSNQNYKNKEWENGDFKATLNIDTELRI